MQFIKNIIRDFKQTLTSARGFLRQDWTDKQIEELVYGLLGSTNSSGNLELTANLKNIMIEMAESAKVANLNSKRISQENFI